MDDLVVWLGRQLDDDERIARGTGQPSLSWRNVDMDGELRDDVNAGTVAYVPREGTRAHIARHDPARVLREVEAKRQLLADLLPAPMESATDDELHARSAHPAYEYRTTEGPRKQWDDADRPPSGDAGEPDPGWERNTAAGRGGWERFDLTEESYWRRRLPVGQERKPQAPQWLRRMAAVYADRPGYRSEWAPVE